MLVTPLDSNHIHPIEDIQKTPKSVIPLISGATLYLPVTSPFSDSSRVWSLGSNPKIKLTFFITFDRLASSQTQKTVGKKEERRRLYQKRIDQEILDYFHEVEELSKLVFIL